MAKKELAVFGLGEFGSSIAVTLEEKDRINENYRVYEVHRADHT